MLAEVALDPDVCSEDRRYQSGKSASVTPYVTIWYRVYARVDTWVC